MNLYQEVHFETEICERRTALISAAVTGKIDVQSAMPVPESLPCP